MPVEVYGRVLDPLQRVDEANIADDEQIIFEWKIVLTDEIDKCWACSQW